MGKLKPAGKGRSCVAHQDPAQAIGSECAITGNGWAAAKDWERAAADGSTENQRGDVEAVESGARSANAIEAQAVRPLGRTQKLSSLS